MECLAATVTSKRASCRGIIARRPFNAIWEGSGNVMCLDVLRAVARDRDAAPQLLEQLAGETKGLPGASAAAKTIAEIMSRADNERLARMAVERLALLRRRPRSMPQPRRWRRRLPRCGWNATACSSAGAICPTRSLTR